MPQVKCSNCSGRGYVGGQGQCPTETCEFCCGSRMVEPSRLCSNCIRPLNKSGMCLAHKCEWERRCVQSEAEKAAKNYAQRIVVNTILARTLTPLVPDVHDRIRIGNQACTEILKGLEDATATMRQST